MSNALCNGAESPAGLPSISNPGILADETLERIACSDAPILITGESPNLRARMARRIHALGTRADAPFEAISCYRLPEALLEAELFGGRVHAAHLGTVFLDEVADLSPGLQGLILCFLKTGQLRRWSDDHGGQVANVRLIAGVSDDLGQAVAAGTFRRDLFYRLNVLNLTLPPPSTAAFVEPDWAGRRDGSHAGREVSDVLWDRMARGESFWSAVYPPFMEREITRADLREVIRKGLSEARGHYTIVARLFNIDQTGYRRFLSFLRKYDCQIPFRPFRQVP